MKNEIVEKLKGLMTTLPIDSEANVVYLLTQVRKTFEHDDSMGQSCPTLRFFCNWALHIQLEQGAAQTYLNAVMPILTLDGSHDEAAQAKLNSLLTLESFRDELSTFLKQNDIDESLCSGADYWAAFLRAYSGVVQDCKLVLKGSESTKPRGPLVLAVESVTVRSVAGSNFISATTFPMVWCIRYTDGRVGDLKMSERGLLGAVLDLRPAQLPVHVLKPD